MRKLKTGAKFRPRLGGSAKEVLLVMLRVLQLLLWLLLVTLGVLGRLLQFCALCPRGLQESCRFVLPTRYLLTTFSQACQISQAFAQTCCQLGKICTHAPSFHHLFAIFSPACQLAKFTNSPFCSSTCSLKFHKPTIFSLTILSSLSNFAQPPHLCAYFTRAFLNPPTFSKRGRLTSLG